MPQIILKDVTLAFCQNMLRESTYGGYNYSFIIDEDTFCTKTRDALSTQKSKQWGDEENTNNNILKRLNAKRREDVTYAPVAEMMKDTDILIQVKSKEHPINNTKGCSLGAGTTADIIIDVFEFTYNKKKMLCVRSHSDRGCTVKVNKLNEFSGATKYFDVEESASTGFNVEAVETVEVPF